MKATTACPGLGGFLLHPISRPRIALHPHSCIASKTKKYKPQPQTFQCWKSRARPKSWRTGKLNRLWRCGFFAPNHLPPPSAPRSGRISGFVFKCKNILLLGKQSESQSPVGSSCQWQHVVANVEACHRLWTADAVKCMCEFGCGCVVWAGLNGRLCGGMFGYVCVTSSSVVVLSVRLMLLAASQTCTYPLTPLPLLMLQLALGHRQH